MTRFLLIFVLIAAGTQLVGCSGGEGASGPAGTQEAHAAQDAHDSHDAHASHEGAATAPPGGALWPTDEGLRTGMARIDAAVDRAMAVTQPLTREQAEELARAVEQNVSYIIENCRLPPEPDAALHVLIGRMMAAAGQLRNEATTAAALTSLRGVLQVYRSTFDHAPASGDAS
jgi:hypothetical protein